MLRPSLACLPSCRCGATAGLVLLPVSCLLAFPAHPTSAALKTMRLKIRGSKVSCGSGGAADPQNFSPLSGVPVGQKPPLKRHAMYSS
eukprot:9053167-Alexandrium_andersonii.AAC.1